jgi:hypothetical protein
MNENAYGFVEYLNVTLKKFFSQPTKKEITRPPQLLNRETKLTRLRLEAK